MTEYAGLALAREHGPEWVLTKLREAGLRGRGGSGEGRPVAEKWGRVARASAEVRFVIGNGAEGSPASKKDRHLMSRFPHRVLEGLLVAAHVVGASEAFLYVRGDSDESLDALGAAVAEAREAGLLGGVDVQIQPSVPTLISGEETAVIDALEGLEGLPQPKPPRPEEAGLRGYPTLVTNVETLAAAAAVLRDGPAAAQKALFTVSGDVAAPGVYEVAYGTPLADLLRMAGAPPASDLLAVLPGGLTAGPLRPDELDVPLTYEGLAAVGSSIGLASVIVVSRERATMAELAAETSAYLAAASCGQCQGCKEGQERLAQAFGARDVDGAREVATMLQYGRGNCAFPTGAARFALRAIQAFPEAWSK